MVEAVVVSLLAAAILAEEGRAEVEQKEACVDTLDEEKSKYTCLQFACLGLCPKSFVRDACRATCGICGDSAGKHGLPQSPKVEVSMRHENSATLVYAPLESMCKITSVEVSVAPSVHGKSSIVKRVTRGNEIRIMGLLPGAEYTFKVRAKSAFGWSPYSNEVTTGEFSATKAAEMQKEQRRRILEGAGGGASKKTAAQKLAMNKEAGKGEKKEEENEAGHPSVPARGGPRRRGSVSEQEHKKKKRRFILAAQAEAERFIAEREMRRAAEL